MGKVMRDRSGNPRHITQAGVTKGFEHDPWKIHIVLLIAVGMTLTGVSILNVALPSIKDSLSAPDSGLQWILTGYALTFGIFLIAAGRAGDVLGQQGLFIVGVSTFCAASVAAAFAPNIQVLIAARLIQGVGSGLVSPQVVGLIQHIFQGRERARAFGAYGSVVALTMGTAPFIGGAVIAVFGEDTGWRWAFLVNVPVAVLAIILAFRWFPRPFWKPAIRFKRLDLDVVGMGLMALAVLGIMYPFVAPFDTNWIWASVGVAVILFYVWTKWEQRYRRRGRAPMIDTRIFSNRNFTNGVTIGLLYFLGATGIWVIVAIYMVDGLGHTALEAGVIGIPSALCGIFAAQWAGKRVTDRGRVIVITGVLVSIVSLGMSTLVIWLNSQGILSIWWLLISLVGVGFGQGSVVNPNQTLTLTEVPLNYAGSSGGILQTGQRIGVAIGVAITTGVLFSVSNSHGWSSGAMAALFTVIVALICTLILAVIDAVKRRNIIAAVAQ